MLALSLMGGAAVAAFTSSATNTGNTFGAGSLTLQLNGGSNTAFFTISGAKPGDSSQQVITLANTGSLNSAHLFLTSIGHNSTSTPDLGSKLTLDLYDDANGNGSIDAGETLIKSAHITDNSWANTDLGVTLNAAGSHKVIAKLTFDADADNSFQSTNSTFSFNFQAN